MTRINANISPEHLVDKHLFVEFREITRVPSQLSKRLASNKGLPKNMPTAFKLGGGHQSFFLDKGLFLHKRYDALVAELLKRGYNINAYFDWSAFYADKLEYYKDHQMTDTDNQILCLRLIEKLSNMDNLKLNKQPITRENAINLLKLNYIKMTQGKQLEVSSFMPHFGFRLKEAAAKTALDASVKTYRQKITEIVVANFKTEEAEIANEDSGRCEPGTRFYTELHVADSIDTDTKTIELQCEVTHEDRRVLNSKFTFADVDHSLINAMTQEIDNMFNVECDDDVVSFANFEQYFTGAKHFNIIVKFKDTVVGGIENVNWLTDTLKINDYLIEIIAKTLHDTKNINNE